MKSEPLIVILPSALSQSARTVWIEISVSVTSAQASMCHSLRGLCGLKSRLSKQNSNRRCHSLRGLCGLKSAAPFIAYPAGQSQSARTVWIEITNGTHQQRLYSSQSARTVWIEIILDSVEFGDIIVTVCEDCVD